MYSNTMSGYPAFPSPQIAVFPKTSSAGIPYLGSPDPTALFRQSAPTGYSRHTAIINSGSVPNRNFARSGGAFVHVPRFQTVSLDCSSSKVAEQPPFKDAVPSAEVTIANSDPAAADEQPQQQEGTLANTKEKTPMCLINELARFNKVQHQYCLTDEQGPAHKKTFFVKLKLGDEEFAASGASIKKAQHAAASVALQQTKYPHPLPKKSSSGEFNQTKATNSSVTPTVELNALAMKRGEPAVYRVIERKTPPVTPPSYYPQPYGIRGASNAFYGHRSRYSRAPHRLCVALKVGEREFIGEGETLQAARHCAASLALKMLKSLPLPTNEPTSKLVANADNESRDTDSVSGKVCGGSESLKSEISLVHETALKRNYTVEFEIVKESGPPHMRTFITRCKCGELIAEGEGSSKKLSKKRAAEKMVEELNKLPHLPPPPAGVKPKKSLKPKPSKNLIKNVLNNCSAGVNPISRLIQIQQAKKEKEPTFAMVEEKGLPRAREFHIQVTVGDNTCTGVGPNKRLAKRSAAEQMLQLLGYSLLAPQPTKPALKSVAAEGRSVSPSSSSSSPTRSIVGPSGGGSSGDRRVTFVDPDPSQIRSGAASVAVSARHNVRHSSLPMKENAVSSDIGPSSARAGFAVNRPSSVNCAARPMDELSFLAKIMSFKLNINSYPKDETKTEFISIITIATGSTTQFFNGVGSSIEASNDNAAVDALQKLKDYGLGNQNHAQGPASDNKVNYRSSAKTERPISSSPIK